MLGATVVALLQAGSVHAADSWNLLPAADEGYQAQPTVALLGGQLDPAESGLDSATATGVELSLNCPLLAAPGGTIRQQLSYVRYDKDDVEITTIEINPHYMIDVADNLQVGFGPGLGYVSIDTPAGDDAALALQFGGSVQYRLGRIYLGAEARWQWAGDVEIANTDVSPDNTRVLAKVGFNF
jgi:hypothetical protein